MKYIFHLYDIADLSTLLQMQTSYDSLSNSQNIESLTNNNTNNNTNNMSAQRLHIETQINRAEASARADAIAIENWHRFRRNQVFSELNRLEMQYNVEMAETRSEWARSTARTDAIAISNWYQFRKNQVSGELSRLEMQYNEEMAETNIGWAQRLAILHNRLRQLPADVPMEIADEVIHVPPPQLERHENVIYQDPEIGLVNGGVGGAVDLPEPLQLDFADEVDDDASDDASDAEHVEMLAPREVAIVSDDEGDSEDEDAPDADYDSDAMDICG